jgi:serine O-acetyltransferase
MGLVTHYIKVLIWRRCLSKLPYWFYFVYHKLYLWKVPFIPKLFVLFNRLVWGAYIPASCQIGEGSVFAYGGSGVVIHATAIIGKHCNIGTCVTIGGRGKHSRGAHTPIIGDNVFIGTGAKILGAITIGDNVVIGANSVVISSVEDNQVVAGVPAKVIKKNVTSIDFF